MQQPTFKQFLTEQEDELKTDIETVIEECSEFFQAINGDPTTYKLYRGISGPPLRLQKKSIRTGRVPKDTPNELHEMYDRWFKENHGIAFRSNSIQATGSKIKAEDFGRLHVIFPTNGYKFIWSPDIRDFTDDINPKVAAKLNRIKENPAQYGYSEEDVKKWAVEDAPYWIVDEALSSVNWKTTDIDQAIKSYSEIMITGDSYYALPYREEHVLEYIKDAAKKKGFN